jgi:hypothetical protein
MQPFAIANALTSLVSYFVIHRLAVDIVAQRGGDFAQALAVFAAGRRERVALLSIFASLVTGALT